MTLKPTAILNRLYSRKGESVMEDETFKELFQRLMDQYEMDPETAATLLQRILNILQNNSDHTLQKDSKHEILIEYQEGEERL